MKAAMVGRRVLLLTVLGLVSAQVAGRSQSPPQTKGTAPATATTAVPALPSTVRAFLDKRCTSCHSDDLQRGGLSLESAAATDYGVWDDVRIKLQSGVMPPPERARPPAAELVAMIKALESHLVQLEKAHGPDPGRVTARRLNRTEYDNTIRDLVGVSFKPADDFPSDDTGYGFDNIGDVLAVSPSLMELYLATAGKIAKAAIVIPKAPAPTTQQFRGPDTHFVPLVEFKYNAPVDGDYAFELYVEMTGPLGMNPPKDPATKYLLYIDGAEAGSFDFVSRGVWTEQVRKRLTPGEHAIKAVVPNEVTAVPEPDVDNLKRMHGSVEYVEVRGPFQPSLPPITATHRRIFQCGHAFGEHNATCARRDIVPLAERAYRRPLDPQEQDELVRLVTDAQEDGESLEEAMQLGLQAILVSPNFLFRIEREGTGVRPLNDFELASRLSYFLWSSMPDEALFKMARAGSLRNPAVLETEVKRMLADPKSATLVDNFGWQWLKLRPLETAKPDPTRFPGFDDELRTAMATETRMFFESVIKEDRSILDFIDGKYTFLNERLAKHYGIGGIMGPEFRRVPLAGRQRSGILTQASVLTVTSYPGRTSPVLRGRWLLENILDAPPPPPPPNVPNLNEQAIGQSASLRQQLEQHRSNSACATCHSRMDPLGFGLENYDATGGWRIADGNFPVDSSAKLPDGRTFEGQLGLKAMLRSHKDEFAAAFLGKMMTFALGRGKETYDRPEIRGMVTRLAASNYRFSQVVSEIVRSAPFRMRRAEEHKP